MRRPGNGSDRLHPGADLAADGAEYVAQRCRGHRGRRQSEAELARLSVACEQDPLNPALQVGSACCSIGSAPGMEAIDALECATVLAPDARVPWSLLAASWRGRAARSEAEAALRRLSALDPGNPMVRNDHAAVLMRSAPASGGAGVLLDVLDRHGTADARFVQPAWRDRMPGLQEEAVAVARRAISLASGRADAATGALQHPGVSRRRYRERSCWRRCANAVRRCPGRRSRPPSIGPNPTGG